MKSAIDGNMKTYRSYDNTTICPKLKENNPCPYCYVQDARKIGCNAKIKHSYRPYKNDVLRMRPDTIKKLNKGGGIRMFSFGDYLPEFDNDIQSFLDDCKKVGLNAKAITKQPDFVYRWHKHPALKVINLSVDNIKHGVPWPDAIRLREKYSKVRVRSVVLNDYDLSCLDWTDVITLNHGHNGYHNYTKKEMKSLSKKYSKQLCCITGKCHTCKVRCGI